MANPILTVGPAPHLKSGANVLRNHYFMALALLPAAVAAVMMHGIQAVAILLLAITTAMGTEALSQYLMRQPIYALDGHSLLMGLLFGLLMPPSAPWWIILLGTALAIFIGKAIFGGLGGYAFHPAMIGYLMILLSWPGHIMPVGGNQLANACPYAILLGGAVIWLLGTVNRAVPIAFIVGIVGSAAIFSTFYPEQVAGPFAPLASGGVWLAAFFILTDETSSPANCLAKILFGLTAGVLVMLIEVFGIWAEVTPFAVLLANMVAPMFDRITPKHKSMEASHA